MSIDNDEVPCSAADLVGATDDRARSTVPTTAIGALTGVVAALVALGVAELVAAFDRTWRSPVFDVGDRVIDRVPSSVKDLAIEWFGTNDKIALLAGIGVLLLLYAAVIGALSFRRDVRVGLTGIALFAAIGVWAVATRRVATPLTATLPTVIGAAAGVAALWSAHRQLAPTLSETRTGPTVDASSRRAFIARGATVLGTLTIVAAAAGTVGRAIRSRLSAAESRAKLRLPDADVALEAVPPSVSVDVAGVSPFITPNADFYRIDTALSVPQVPAEDWSLRIVGMVDRELELSFDDLLGHTLHEYDITLTCVSNTIGGELVGNARWLGVRLDELLREARVDPDADQVVGRSVDGYTCGFPVDAALDGRNAIVAVGMNGEPLPLVHGFPARLVVPGLYGYVSATKWLSEIELTRFDRFEQYWVPRGYAERAPIKLMARIDSVDGLDTLRTGPDGVAAIGGVAWAQTRGIVGVEVQVDDGPWEPAELGTALSEDTWRQWAYRWSPTAPGRTSIRVRAIDGNGVIQTDARAEPLPDGASGHHQIVVFVE